MFRIPNRAKSLTVISSKPINENWEAIESSVNTALDLSDAIDQKVDIAELGEINGIATLDDSRKLSQDQLPKNAIGHVYSVESLEEQLNLDAYSGDICVREDIGKTYALSDGVPSNFENWIEIAATLGGGDTFGNPAFTENIKESDWQLGGKGFYTTYTSLYHSLGNTKDLIVNVKNENYENIICNYTVDEEGTVTIFSDSAFNGSIIISDLRGNCKNQLYTNYCVNNGSYNNEEPSLIVYTYDTIYLATKVPIIIVDGLGVLHRITVCKPDVVPSLSGRIILFIDSDNINNSTLNKLSFVKANDYLGILEKLPTEGVNGQRCYIKFDGSYEYDGGWKYKAFTPIGEITANSGIVEGVKTYPYNENGMNITNNTKVFNHLYGSQIHGMNISVTDNLLTVTQGKCLIDNDIVTTDNITKNCTSIWAKGDNRGCVSPYDTNMVGWVNVYLIYDGITTDVIVSNSIEPTLPEPYTSYRLIGNIFFKEDGGVVDEKQYDDYVYLAEPLEHLFEIQSNKTRNTHGNGANAGGGIVEDEEDMPNEDGDMDEDIEDDSDEDLEVTDIIEIPNGVNTVKIYYELLTEPQTLIFSTQTIPMTQITTTTSGIIEVPTDNGGLFIYGNMAGNILIKLIAFKNSITNQI